MKTYTSSTIKCITHVLCTGIVMLMLSCSLYAEGVGSSAVATLFIPVSAKTAGMAEACSSISGSIVSLHYNPAGIALLENHEIMTMYRQGFASDQYASLLFGTHLESMGLSLGAGVLYYSSGDITLYDLSGTAVSKNGMKDIIVILGTGFNFAEDKVSLGLSIKGISSELFGEKAAACAGDAGIQYHGPVTIGIAAQNFGSSVKYVDTKEDLPALVRGGISVPFRVERHSMVCAFDVPYYINEEEARGHAGFEYNYQDMFMVRGGYIYNISDTSRSDEAHLTAGIGIKSNSYCIDYSVGFVSNLDMPHMISFGMRFGNRENSTNWNKSTWWEDDDTNYVPKKKRLIRQRTKKKPTKEKKKETNPSDRRFQLE
ncbi:MAG: PorV/PorQ family protein [Elusimicrobia bacterium]|nr:PorV/PorQ family protein [Elusimicrobiota bacterium]MBD3412034.1 PorV/PorQ family protein [Elusimicrobiota bacterium]